MVNWEPPTLAEVGYCASESNQQRTRVDGREQNGRNGKESGPSSYREAGGDNGH